uniref:CA domain-containing protein n=1 Tax=Steinernema glaseri TaxID=37863 RepID=A0A1I7YXN1_9BILA
MLSPCARVNRCPDCCSADLSSVDESRRDDPQFGRGVIPTRDQNQGVSIGVNKTNCNAIGYISLLAFARLLRVPSCRGGDNDYNADELIGLLTAAVKRLSHLSAKYPACGRRRTLAAALTSVKLIPLQERLALTVANTSDPLTTSRCDASVSPGPITNPVYIVHMSRSLLVPLLLLAVVAAGPITPEALTDIFNKMFPLSPPHCSKSHIINTQFSTANIFVQRNIHMYLSIGLHRTVCFRVMDTSGSPASANSSDDATPSAKSLLHTLTLSRLEHYHPVSQQYTFAIPEVKADCKCECNAQSEVCSAASHQFSMCKNDSDKNDVGSCYRTFFPNQPSGGCRPGSAPKLCCDVKFKPYQNMSFTAVKLEQPTTFAVFRYASYDWVAGRWIQNDTATIRTQLDGGNQNRYLDSKRSIELSVSAGGRASHQLESGMYFVRNTVHGIEFEDLRRQPLNEVTENNFDRLGWYRKDDDGKYYVNNGVVKISRIHSAKVENCQEQVYKSILDANHYIDKDSEEPERFVMPDTVDRIYTWVQSARLYDGTRRHAIVTHSEGTNLQISLELNHDVHNSQMLSFYHNASKILDFTGTIIVDPHSNRYFNLSVYETSGILNGVVKRSTAPDSEEDVTFTVFVSDLNPANRSYIVPLPAMVTGGDRLICIRPDESAEEKELCRIIAYRENPLIVDLVHNSWSELVGHCPECNQISMDGFIKYLNPVSWVNGINNIQDFIMMVTDMVVYIVILLVTYVLLVKCLFPLVQCWLCPFYRRRKN